MGFHGGSAVESACNARDMGDVGSIPGWRGEDPLEEEMATHSSILAWKLSWTQEAGGYSPWGLRVGQDWATEHSTPV